MDYFLPNKFTKSTEDLSHNFEYFFLFELLSLHELFKISVFAEFCYDVETVLGAENIFKLDYVRMIKSFKQIYF